MILIKFFYHLIVRLKQKNVTDINNIPREKLKISLKEQSTMTGIWMFLEMGFSKCSIAEADVDMDSTTGTTDLGFEKATLLLLLHCLLILLPVKNSNLSS